MDKFFHSVYLDEELCMGCINCIKRCPTQAIRVRHGKAVITGKFCIDCGECVRICPHHAKLIRRDSVDVLKKYKYTVALPAPTLYSQFNHLDDINIVLTALIYLGFDDIFEVSAGAELVSAASREYVSEHPEKWPLISTACPSVVRLIRVRFPNLIEHLLPLNPPVEVAARLARERAVKNTGLDPEDIGIVFISPCPSKVTYAHSPLGVGKSQIDHVLAIKDVYPLLLPLMQRARQNPKELAMSGRIGVGWGGAGGEAGGLITDSYLAADGIENVIRVLEDMEDEKFGRLQFIELNACNGGCVGGVLTVENPYVAKAKLKHLNKYLPVSMNHLEDYENALMAWTDPVEYEPVFRLGSTFSESIRMLKEVETLCGQFPGLDCGACGAPTCRALAEDIVRGDATKDFCIPVLKNHIHELAGNYMELLDSVSQSGADSSISTASVRQYIEKLMGEVSLLDAHLEAQNEGGKKKESVSDPSLHATELKEDAPQSRTSAPFQAACPGKGDCVHCAYICPYY